MQSRARIVAGGMKMYSIREQIRQLLKSPCPLCGLQARGGDLCPPCENAVHFDYQPDKYCGRCWGVVLHDRTRAQTVAQQRCDACLAHPQFYTRVVAGMHFAVPGDRLMRGFKSQGRLTDAGLFARLLWQNMKTFEAELPVLKALVPIPSGREAMLQRGQNPAGEIARELAWLSGVPLKRGLLARTREVSRQKTLGWHARQKSTEGLYVCPATIQGGWIGLVDDVLTTGITLERASEALLRAGAEGVVALVAARTLAK